MNIGVIDSGIGGLTVLFDVIKEYPNCNYFYLGDSKNCPYGIKSTEEIKNMTYNMVKYLVKNNNIDIVILACNSISCSAYNYLKEEFPNLIIIETITPTTNYIKRIGSKVIGLIATNATINSKMYEKKLNGYQIYSKAIPIFVNIVEDININSDEKVKIVEDELKDILNKNIDTLILGCTHFPLLYSSIRKIYDGNIVTNSNAIINELSKYIKKDNKKGMVKIYTTGNRKIFEEKIKKMFNKNYEVEKVEIR